MAVLHSSQPNPQRKQKKRKMYAIKQIKICAEYRDMLPRPRLDLSGTPGLRPIGLSPGSWQTSLGLGSMSRYSAQILICISNRRFFSSCDLEIWLMTSKKHQALCIISNPSANSNWSYCQETLNSDQNRQFFVPCDLEIWWMTLKNNRAPLLYVASNFMHHFIAIGELQLKLQCRNAQFGSKSAIFCPVWPWNLMDDIEKQ